MVRLKGKENQLVVFSFFLSTYNGTDVLGGFLCVRTCVRACDCELCCGGSPQRPTPVDAVVTSAEVTSACLSQRFVFVSWCADRRHAVLFFCGRPLSRA